MNFKMLNRRYRYFVTFVKLPPKCTSLQVKVVLKSCTSLQVESKKSTQVKYRSKCTSLHAGTGAKQCQCPPSPQNRRQSRSAPPPPVIWRHVPPLFVRFSFGFVAFAPSVHITFNCTPMSCTVLLLSALSSHISDLI